MPYYDSHCIKYKSVQTKKCTGLNCNGSRVTHGIYQRNAYGSPEAEQSKVLENTNYEEITFDAHDLECAAVQCCHTGTLMAVFALP